MINDGAQRDKPKPEGLTIMAVDPGRETGIAVYRGNELIYVYGFTVGNGTNVQEHVNRVVEYARPAYAVIEEHGFFYQQKTKSKDGKNFTININAIKTNIECRRRVTACIARCGIIPLGVPPTVWKGNHGKRFTRTIAESELRKSRSRAVSGVKLNEHKADAIALCEWAVANKPWEMR